MIQEACVDLETLNALLTIQPHQDWVLNNDKIICEKNCDQTPAQRRKNFKQTIPIIIGILQKLSANLSFTMILNNQLTSCQIIQKCIVKHVIHRFIDLKNPFFSLKDFDKEILDASHFEIVCLDEIKKIPTQLTTYTKISIKRTLKNDEDLKMKRAIHLHQKHQNPPHELDVIFLTKSLKERLVKKERVMKDTIL